MTATNHALTGAIIGFTVVTPYAFVVALLSHFFLDVLPHFGTDEKDNVRVKKQWFEKYLIVEFVLCVTLVVVLMIQSPSNWLIPSICAFLAASPDLVSYRRFSALRNNKPFKPNFYERFAGDIQWFERPVGGVVEIVWAICALVLLANLV